METRFYATHQNLNIFYHTVTNDILNVDTDSEGQIWMTMSRWPNTKIGVYIPPCDSPYFSSAQHGTLASHSINTGYVIVMGDFNARVGQPYIVDEAGKAYKYVGFKDTVVNSHGKTLVNICQNNNLVVVNNLISENKP